MCLRISRHVARCFRFTSIQLHKQSACYYMAEMQSYPVTQMREFLVELSQYIYVYEHACMHPWMYVLYKPFGEKAFALIPHYVYR